MSDVASYLRGASEIVDTVASAAPGPFGIAAKIASLALKAGSAIAAAGDDPVTGIARMLSPEPEVKGVHGEWDDFISRNFPPASAPPPPSSSSASFEKRKTDPSPTITDDDPYDDEED